MTARDDDRAAGDEAVTDRPSLDLRDRAPAPTTEGSESAAGSAADDLDNPFALGVADSPGSGPGSTRPAAPTRQAGAVAAPPLVDPAPQAVLDLTEVETPTDEELERRQRRKRRGSSDASAGFLPTRPGRLRIESVFVRLIATAGVIGIGTAVGAILVANDVAGWITGLAVSTLSVILAAVLWRSRRL